MSALPLTFSNKEQLLKDPISKTAPDPTNYMKWQELRKSSTVLQGMFVELARAVWMDGYDFIEGFPSDFRYSPDITKCRLQIDSEFNFTEVVKDPTSLIGIKLGNIEYKKSPGATRDGIIGTSKSTDQQYYSRTGTGTVTFSHIGTSDGQSVSMADATQEFLEAYSGVIRKEFGFNQFEIIGRRPLTEHPRKLYGKERYLSEVVAAFQFENTWQLVLESPKLQEIFFSSGQPKLGRCIIQQDQLSPSEGHEG